MLTLFYVFVFSGLEVLCIVLNRLTYPSRFSQLQEFFHRPKKECNLFFLLGIDHLYQNFHTRITDWNQPWLTQDAIYTYCAAIHAAGSPLQNCWGFVDGTVREMCKPSRNQREVFSGHKRFHGLKFQSIVTPNGLIVNLYGPIPGRRHDAWLLQESDILGHCEATFNDQAGNPLCLFGDSAYPIRNHLLRPYRGVNLTPQQQNFNAAMSSVRMAVEWEFGKIIKLWAFMDFPKNIKLYKSPVGKLYHVAVLLTNFHTCLYGSQTSRHFGVEPPTLEEFLY